jgi:acyl carrier protein
MKPLIVKSKEVMMDKIAEELTSMIAEILKLDAAILWEKRNCHYSEELGKDSLYILEILSRIEQKYDIEFDETKLHEITTLNDSIIIVKELLTSHD